MNLISPALPAKPASLMKKGLLGAMKSYAKRCSPSTTKTTTPFQFKNHFTSCQGAFVFLSFHLQRTPDFSHLNTAPPAHFVRRSPPVPLDREDIAPRNRSLDNMHNPNLGPENSTKKIQRVWVILASSNSSGHSGRCFILLAMPS